MARGNEALVAKAAQARQVAARRRKNLVRLAREAAQLQAKGTATIQESAKVRGSGMIGSARENFAFILLEDPDLGEALDPATRDVAATHLRARVLQVEGPIWDPPSADSGRAYGLLVLSGMLLRRLSLDGAASMELLGAGEILRPWEDNAPWEGLPGELEWLVVAPTRLAVLDERITRLIGRWPELSVAFSSRLLARARAAEYLTAVSHLPRVDDRLLATLWHVACRYGRVTPEGVTVPLRLTHAVLGEMIGARRPSVTLAVQRLQAAGQLVRDPGGWFILPGEPHQMRQESIEGGR